MDAGEGAALTARMKELEGQVRWLRRALISLVAGAVAVVTMAQAGAKPPETLEAQAFDLVDASGKKLARLAPLGADGAYLAFVNAKGEQRLTLSASARGTSIALVNADRSGELHVGVTDMAPSIILSGRSGAEVAMIAEADSGSVLRLLDTVKGEVNLGTQAGSGAFVNLSTPGGQGAQLVAGAEVSGVRASDRARQADATLSVLPKQGAILAIKDRGTLGAGIDVGQERSMAVYDAAGKQVWKAPE